ncbi:integrase (plasmid) [Sphingomonas carotinifaciens]|uniref:integrase n=1 Tax=Sphingomonas carotinifaciens TaxID=1166323 RepID=UPI0039A21DD3
MRFELKEGRAQAKASPVPAGEIIVHRTDGEALPMRGRRTRPEPVDARLARVLGALVPPGAAPVSAIGFDAQLTAMAEASKAALAADLTCYGAWCADDGCSPFPADPEALVRYLRHLDTNGSSPATLARRLASLATAHRLMGLADHAELPTRHAMVRAALKGVRRRKGAAPRQAAPLRFGAALDPHAGKGVTLSAMLTACGTDLQGLRDAALLSLGYDAGLRVSELVAVEERHIDPQPDGTATLFIPSSKTDQEGQGAWAWLSADTMRRVGLWLQAGGITSGPLFRRVGVDRRRARAEAAPLAYAAIPGHTRQWREKLAGQPAQSARITYTVGTTALSRQGVCLIYRRVALAAWDAGLVDLPASDIAEAVRGLSTHSLRVGLTQDLFAAGEDGVGIAQALRWTSPATALRYGRKLAVRSNVAARVLSRVRG